MHAHSLAHSKSHLFEQGKIHVDQRARPRALHVRRRHDRFSKDLCPLFTAFASTAHPHEPGRSGRQGLHGYSDEAARRRTLSTSSGAHSRLLCPAPDLQVFNERGCKDRARSKDVCKERKGRNRKFIDCHVRPLHVSDAFHVFTFPITAISVFSGPLQLEEDFCFSLEVQREAFSRKLIMHKFLKGWVA
ncbi:MAG: hypothetical protein Q9159_000480 [Coniocarpon cinnabarinum]